MMPIRLTFLLSGALLLAAPQAGALGVADALGTQRQEIGVQSGADYRMAQNNGMTLSQAIESVRRKTNGRIVSAETKVQGGREVHYIKVLTRDGKVKTHKVKGRRRGNG